MPASTKSRGPSYPVVDLGCSLADARKIINQVGKDWAEFTLFERAMRKAYPSAEAARRLAALRGYALIETRTRGSDGEKRVKEGRVTKLGNDLAKDQARAADDWHLKFKDALESPKVNATLLQRWGEELQADKAHLMLITELDFSEDAARVVVENIRSDLNLLRSHLREATKRGGGEDIKSHHAILPEGDSSLPRRTLEIPLSRGDKAILSVPTNCSADDVDVIQAFLELVGKNLVSRED